MNPAFAENQVFCKRSKNCKPGNLCFTCSALTYPSTEDVDDNQFLTMYNQEIKAGQNNKASLKEKNTNNNIKAVNDQDIEENKNDEMNNKENNLCVICMEHNYNCVIDCGHLCMCMKCANISKKCPVCEKNITIRTKIILA
jgi:hypothetical protein